MFSRVLNTLLKQNQKNIFTVKERNFTTMDLKQSCSNSTIITLEIHHWFHFITNFTNIKTNENHTLNASTTLLTTTKYILNENKRSTRKKCEICSMVSIKTLKQRHWRRFGVFTVNLEYISQFLCLLLTLNKYIFAEYRSELLKQSS